jgi:hypothetical protein
MKMVKLDDVPIEQGRIPLDQLGDFMDANGNRLTLITISQEMVEEDKANKKTGGLKAELWTGRNFKSKYDINTKKVVSPSIVYEDGLKLTQKWGKIPSGELVKILEEMSHDDTDVLGEHFFEYKLVSQRTGFARLIPVAQSDKEPEQYDVVEKSTKKKK